MSVISVNNNEPSTDHKANLHIEGEEEDVDQPIKKATDLDLDYDGYDA
jgi:hypothetical protein